MKSKAELKAKKQRIKEKLSIRQVCKTTPKEKRGATGEFELFKKIALERALSNQCVVAKHIGYKGERGFRIEGMKLIDIELYGELCYKLIKLEDLTPTNFSHTIPKSRGEKYRLDPDNIEIVSRAYHEWQHTKQIPQTNYIN